MSVTAGVSTQELRGHFEIKNFETTCHVRSLNVKIGTDKHYVEILSDPLFVIEGKQFRVSVGWIAKADAKGLKMIPDLDSSVGVHVEVLPKSGCCFMKFEAELVNADSAKNIKRSSGLYKMGGGVGGYTWVGWRSDQGNGLNVKLKDVFDPSSGWLVARTFRVEARLLLAIDDQSHIVTSETSPHKCLSKDLRALFLSGDRADVVIRVKKEQIRAHSSILIARSSVFAAMLSLPMRERKEEAIIIDDLDFGAVKATVEFMYAGEIESDTLKSDDAALGILEAAHRYNVTSLEDLCVEALASRLDAATVAEWFHVADLIGNVDFRARCLEFIRIHIAEVQGTRKFADFVAKRPALLTEILASLVPPVKRQRTESVE